MEEFDSIITLTDENGDDIDMEIIGSCEYKGAEYFALIPANVEEAEEYVLLKLVIEDGEECLVSIEDDKEFYAVADLFDKSFEELS